MTDSSIYLLENKPDVIGGCGNYLLAYKFSFVNVTDSTRKIGIILCPDNYGDDFFRKSTKYSIEFSKDSIPPKDFTIANDIEYLSREYIPTRVVNKISKAKE